MICKSGWLHLHYFKLWKCDMDNQAVQPAVLINFCSFVFWLCFANSGTHWPSIFAQFRVSTRPPDIQIRYLWWKSFARVIDQHWKHLLLLIDRVQYISDLVHLLWILALKLFSSCQYIISFILDQNILDPFAPIGCQRPTSDAPLTKFCSHQ